MGVTAGTVDGGMRRRRRACATHGWRVRADYRRGVRRSPFGSFGRVLVRSPDGVTAEVEVR